MAQRPMEYVGPVKSLRGKLVDVREVCAADQARFIATLPLGTVMAQFQGNRTWVPVPLVDFREIKEKKNGPQD